MSRSTPRQSAGNAADHQGCLTRLFFSPILMIHYFILMLLAMGLLVLYLHARFAGDLPRQAPPTIEQIRELQSLSVLQVKQSILQETQIRGYLGSQRLLALYQGEVTIGVDLSLARIVATDEASAMLTVELPAPSITSARLNHEPIQIYLLRRRGLWLLSPIDDPTEKLMAQSLREAQAKLTQQAILPAWDQQARQSTQKTLDELAQPTGWHVQWQPLSN